MHTFPVRARIRLTRIAAISSEIVLASGHLFSYGKIVNHGAQLFRSKRRDYG
jgi:hypothetical protein